MSAKPVLCVQMAAIILFPVSFSTTIFCYLPLKSNTRTLACMQCALTGDSSMLCALCPPSFHFFPPGDRPLFVIQMITPPPPSYALLTCNHIYTQLGDVARGVLLLWRRRVDQPPPHHLSLPTSAAAPPTAAAGPCLAAPCMRTAKLLLGGGI